MQTLKLNSILSLPFFKDLIKNINTFIIKVQEQKNKIKNEKDLLKIYKEHFKNIDYKNYNILILGLSWIWKSTIVLNLAKFIQNYLLFWYEKNPYKNYLDLLIEQYLINNKISNFNKKDFIKQFNFINFWLKDIINFNFNINKLFFIKDIRASFYERLDFLSIFFEKNGRKIYEVTNTELIPKDDEYILWFLFLDEITQVPPEVQKILYRIVLERKINENHKLPKGTVIFAAWNLQDEGYLWEIERPLKDRFIFQINLWRNVNETIANIKDDVLLYFKDNIIISSFLEFINKYIYYISDEIVTPRRRQYVKNILSMYNNYSDIDYINLKNNLKMILPEKIYKDFIKFIEGSYVKVLKYVNQRLDRIDNENIKIDDWKLLILKNYLFNLLEFEVDKLLNEKDLKKFKNIKEIIEYFENKDVINYIQSKIEIKEKYRLKNFVKDLENKKVKINQKHKYLNDKYEKITDSWNKIIYISNDFNYNIVKKETKISDLKILLINIFIHLFKNNKNINNILYNLNLIFDQIEENNLEIENKEKLKNNMHIYSEVIVYKIFNIIFENLSYYLKNIDIEEYKKLQKDKDEIYDTLLKLWPFNRYYKKIDINLDI